jgi:hypothetical protein
VVALENQLNSSINHWLRFLGPLQNAAKTEDAGVGDSGFQEVD